VSQSHAKADDEGQAAEDAKPATGEVIHRELSYRVMQAVYEVHNALGPGYAESVYEESLALELGLRGIAYARQPCVSVTYKGHSVGAQRLDLLVEGKIVLEIKAVPALNDLFRRQTLSYLKATGLRLGILINFGAARVEYKRIVHG